MGMRAMWSAPWPDVRARLQRHAGVCTAIGQRAQSRLPSPGVLVVRELRDDSGVMTTYTAKAEGGRLMQQAVGQPTRQQVGPWAALRALYLPSGFPSSVTPDYLAFQLWSVPAHITGYISVGLTTSSLLQAVGISAGPPSGSAATSQRGSLVLTHHA